MLLMFESNVPGSLLRAGGGTRSNRVTAVRGRRRDLLLIWLVIFMMLLLLLLLLVVVSHQSPPPAESKAESGGRAPLSDHSSQCGDLDLRVGLDLDLISSIWSLVRICFPSHSGGGNCRVLSSSHLPSGCVSVGYIIKWVQVVLPSGLG